MYYLRYEMQALTDSPEVADRRVRGLLDKLTPEKSNSISDRIIEEANKEKDGRTLKVI
jgi:translation initiation factor 4G